MYKHRIFFIVVFLISTGAIAQTDVQKCTKSCVKSKHNAKCNCHKSKHYAKKDVASNNSSALVTPTSGMAVKPKCEKNCSQQAFIESLNVPQSTKNLLYDYSMTQEGQRVLSRAISPSLLGPTESSISTPIGYAADWGTISAGVNYVDRWMGTKTHDGFAGVNVGFGDAERYAGLSVSVLIDSINPFDGGFAENGTVAAQLFHVFPHDFALAVGAGNIAPWGAFKDSSNSYFAVGSKVFGFSINKYEMPLTLSLGAGTGGFSSIRDAQEGNDGNIKPFGSVGWRIFPQLSVIGEWAAKQTNVGLSITPIAKLPVVLGISDCNITHSQGYNSYFMASIAIGYSF